MSDYKRKTERTWENGIVPLAADASPQRTENEISQGMGFTGDGLKCMGANHPSEELRKQWMDAYTADIAQKKAKPSRGILIGMAWCALFWIALGLIVWMVR